MENVTAKLEMSSFFRRQCPHILASQRLENVGNRLIFCVYPWLAQELVLIFSPPVCASGWRFDGAKAIRCQVYVTIILLAMIFGLEMEL
jgi:hypothetical protein